MIGTISGGSSVIAPTLILALSEESDAGNIVHPILGRTDPDITLRAGGRRTGTLELGFAGQGSEAASATARNVLATAGLLTLNAPSRATLHGMRFVAVGQVVRELDPNTRNDWIVRVGYQEVTP